ncbi:carbon-nitrogen hydrolase family protein [Corynebacterium capitovis]|uniref:carbon-nitrogen hydrolase family protein n=1 Tax=Corynebacterium capitovis TaxID=131081 RepID=UPI000478393D|nr:carbon-nitrogen hydrolase family protein [Corynebacterium capitovis]
MNIALLQITTSGDKRANLALVSERVREAAAAGATLIVAPEACSQAFGCGRLDTQAEDLDGPFATALRQLADDLGVTIVAGMFRLADKNGGLNRVYNTALITGGGVHKGYNKIHTYDAFDYRESDTVKPGNALVTFVHGDAVVGVATCFDIRYPEQFKDLARRGADVVVVPTSWADGAGKKEQWRALTVARALDAGLFIAAAGQARPGGDTEAGKDSGPTGIGHSVIVGPLGTRIAEGGYGEEIVYASISLDDVRAARRVLPLLGN